MTMTPNALKVAREEGILFLPESYLRQHNINPASVAPSWLVSRQTILEGVEGIKDLSQINGRAGKPGEFTLIGRTGGKQPLIIVHDKQTEAAEIEDLALEAAERKPFDFAAARDRKGLMPREQFSDALKQAGRDYVKRAKANPVTVKPRQPQNQFVKGLVTVPSLPFKV